MQHSWSSTCHPQLFPGPEVQSCHNCKLLPVLRHAFVGQTQLSGLGIAVKPKELKKENPHF